MDSHLDSHLVEYYAARAAEYERIYAKPERQADLAALRSHVARLLAGHDVLELACGTGYWTSLLAPGARSILATDLSGEALTLARAKTYPEGRVAFAHLDAYHPAGAPGRFTAAFAGFWWSHVPRERLAAFVGALHRRLGVGALVVFLDNRYVAGSSTPVSRTDERGNTYQVRTLADGRTYEVLKNFPAPAELLAALAGAATDSSLTELQYYWLLSYRVASAG
jgi:demethylmenaquinone methyltransferase/2-methoxy-6-polyprenyl-1,4-benzoquinol methylase